MKKTLLCLFTAVAALSAAGKNTLLLNMESREAITAKNARFHGGAFADGAPIGNSVTNGNRAFVGGGAKEGIELPISALPLQEGNISLYFKINKNAVNGKGFLLVSAVGTPPYHNNFGIGIVPGKDNASKIHLTLVGAKVKNTVKSTDAVLHLDREVFYHLSVNWKNINSGKADGWVEIYLNGKLIAQKRNILINIPNPGKKLFIGSCDLEHTVNKCGQGVFTLDEVSISDQIQSAEEIKKAAALLPANDLADGRILPGMPVKGGGRRQFTAYTIDNFPLQHGAIFCRFRVDELIPKKSILLFDNTASPAWNDRIALMLKMFDNNVVEFYFVIYGARTKTYTSKVASKTMPLDPTKSHSVMVKWKNINSGTSNGVMEVYVDGVNVANTSNFMTRFDRVSNQLRVGGGVPPSGVFARKDLLTIEEFRIWRGDVPAAVMNELFQKKNTENVKAAINLPFWRGNFKNDGKIDRSFWLYAADFGGFHSLRHKGILDNLTQVKAACDEKNLYLMWQARHPEAAPRGQKHGMRDAPLWRQDSLEVHFDTPEGKTSILISAFGEIYDARNKLAAWNSSIKVAVGRVPGERIWSGTAVIPLSEISADKTLIKGTVCRNVSGLQDSSSAWKTPYGSCGDWQLAMPLAVSNVAMPDMVSVGNNVIRVMLNARDGKSHHIAAELNIKVKGKTYTTTLRRDMKRQDLEFPLSFAVPQEGRVEYSLKISDENGSNLWSNCGFFDVKPQLVLTIKNEFYRNRLNVSVDARNVKPLPQKGVAKILKDGQVIGDAVDFSLNNGMAKIALDTSKITQHSTYTLLVTVTDQAGKTSPRIEQFEFSPKPAGYPLNAGKKPYFGNFWSTPKFENGVVRCWNRVYTWKDSIFPASITSGGVEMLSATPYFEYRVNGKLKRLSSASIKPLGGDEEKTLFEVHAADKNLVIRAKVRVEYDGFIGYDLDAAPQKGSKIDKLAMVIPMQKDSAQAKLQGLETTYSAERNLIRNYPKNGRHFKFAAKAGLGCFDRGLFIALESDEMWLPYDRDNVEEIIPAGEQVLWRWNIIDGVEFKSLPTQRMGFQVTPYKPLKKDQLQNYRTFQVYPGGILRPADIPYKLETLPKFKKLGVNVLVLHLNWAKYCGGYEPDDRERFRKFIQEAHKLGMKVLVYRASITNEFEPSFLYYGELWQSKPSSSFYGNPVNPRYKLSSSGRCPNSPGYIDWYVGMAAQLIKDYDVDGFYYDFGLGGCSNALHGCGYAGKNTTSTVGEATGTIGVNISSVTAEDRARRLTTAVFKQRELWKRMYNMVKELKGEEGIIDAHTSAPDRVFSYPFVDSMYHSESAATHKGLKVDPEMYRLYFAKQSLGTRGEIILYARGKDQAKQVRRMLALTLLHREIYRPITNKYEHPGRDYKTLAAVKLWNIFQRNKVDDAQWLPYWENRSYAVIENGSKDTLISLWQHKDRLLLTVSNLGSEPRDLKVVLTEKAGVVAQAVDAENPKKRFPVKNNTLALQLPPEDFRLIEVTLK